MGEALQPAQRARGGGSGILAAGGGAELDRNGRMDSLLVKRAASAARGGSL